MRYYSWVLLFLLSSIQIGCLSTEGKGGANLYTLAYNVLLDQDSVENYEVFLMDLNGDHQINLTNHQAVDWVCHADNQNVYFISDRNSHSPGRYHLFRINIQTGNLVQFYKDEVAASWLGSRKEGLELVVCKVQEDRKSLVVLDSNGLEISEILSIESYNINDPSFSPDGRWITYRSNRSGRDEIWISDEFGIGRKRLTFYPGEKGQEGNFYHAGPPTWIPNSEEISYTSKQGDHHHIFVMNRKGLGLRRATDTSLDEGWHDWSADGRFLVFDATNSQKSTKSDLYLYDIKTRKTRQLTHTRHLSERAPVFVVRPEGTF